MEIVPVTTLVSGKSCGIIFYQSRVYIFTISFVSKHYRTGKDAYLTSKHCESLVKTKIDIFILFLVVKSVQQSPVENLFLEINLPLGLLRTRKNLIHSLDHVYGGLDTPYIYCEQGIWVKDWWRNLDQLSQKHTLNDQMIFLTSYIQQLLQDISLCRKEDIIIFKAFSAIIQNIFQLCVEG